MHQQKDPDKENSITPKGVHGLLIWKPQNEQLEH